MNQNVYAAPSAALSDVDDGNATVEEVFYVVSPRKFLILFFGTVSMYVLYWMYKHWKQYKRRTQGRQLPVLRAIFAIFFFHSLFARIREWKAKAGDQTSWSSGWYATGLVALYILSPVMDMMSVQSIGTPVTDFASLVFLLPMGLLHLKAQEYANIASGDREGERNSRLTGANYCWLVVGALFWAMVLIDLFANRLGN